MIDATRYAAEAQVLRAYAASVRIPYARNGHSLEGMDCQGLCEYLLTRCGISYSQCNLAGSNSHYRACVWTGTLEQCRQRFGGEIPAGAWLFILEPSGGEPEKYRGDGIGDASHMGVYLSGGYALHASASRGKVAVTAITSSSSWNRVGLPKWVNYGASASEEVSSDAPEGDAIIADTATIVTADGNPVKMRSKPSKRCSLYWKIPNGEAVELVGFVIRSGKTWAKVKYGSRRGYVMAEYILGG